MLDAPNPGICGPGYSLYKGGDMRLFNVGSTNHIQPPSGLAHAAWCMRSAVTGHALSGLRGKARGGAAPHASCATPRAVAAPATPHVDVQACPKSRLRDGGMDGVEWDRNDRLKAGSGLCELTC